MESKVINKIKQSRNQECKKKFGKEYLYDPNIDLYNLKNSKDVMIKKPFAKSDCIKDENITYNSNDKFYINVPKKKTCDRLNGVWSGEMLNRKNKVDKGMCWKTEDDKNCARLENEIIHKKKNLHKKTLEINKKNCNKSKKCIWNNKSCNSKQTLFANDTEYIPDGFPVDLSTSDSSKNVFSSLINDPIISYAELLGQGNRCTPEHFKKKELSLAQIVIQNIGKSISQNNNSNRGVLAWHSTGSGKTITSMAIIDSFWNSNKNIVFVSSVEALQSNPPTTFYKNANYFKRFMGKSQETTADMFKKRQVKFMTFSQLAHFLLISKPLKSVKTESAKEYHRTYLSNAVLIIDEVQNIFHPLPNQRSEHNALKKFLLDEDSKLNRNMKVFILTATPGDSVEETIDLLNMVRNRKNKHIEIPNVLNDESLNRFKNDTNGLVSYFNSAKDLTRFPKIVSDNTYNLEMLRTQFESYVDAFNNTKNKDTNFDALSKSNRMNQYYKTLRKYSNMQYNFDSKDPISFFSIKIPKLLEVISKNENDKHYIYSAFYEKKGFGGQGIRAVATFLERELNYVRINNEKDFDKIPVGKKGYVLAITNELKNKEHLKTLVKLYNENEQVNVFLASQSFNEGVDLKNTKHIHLFEPMLTFNAEKQAIGRAVRFCSHSTLPYNEWTTSIHRYHSEIPKDLTIYNTTKIEEKLLNIDNLLFMKNKSLEELKGKRKITEIRNQLKAEIVTLSKEKRKLMKSIKEIKLMNIDKINNIDSQIYRESIERVSEQNIILETMKQKAIDCYLMKDYHNNGNEDIQCI